MGRCGLGARAYSGTQSEDGRHHEGHAERTIPLFPELRPYLAAVFDEAEPGTTHVITRYRNPSQNLRTHMLRIIRKAGLTPWEKPFQNCRSSRETELCETFPLHVVTAWLGNTAPVAMKHYLQVREQDFDRAAGSAQAAKIRRSNPRKAVARSRNQNRATMKIPLFCRVLRVSATPCKTGDSHPRFERGLNGPEPFVLPLHQRGAGGGQIPGKRSKAAGGFG